MLYTCPDDSLKKISNILKAEKLWMTTEEKADSPAIPDMVNSSWSALIAGKEYGVYSSQIPKDQYYKILENHEEILRGYINPENRVAPTEAEKISGSLVGIEYYAGGNHERALPTFTAKLTEDKKVACTVKKDGQNEEESFDADNSLLEELQSELISRDLYYNYILDDVGENRGAGSAYEILRLSVKDENDKVTEYEIFSLSKMQAQWEEKWAPALKLIYEKVLSNKK